MAVEVIQWLDTADGLAQTRAVIVALSLIPFDDAISLIDAYLPAPLKPAYYRLIECEKLREQKLYHLLKK